MMNEQCHKLHSELGDVFAWRVAYGSMHHQSQLYPTEDRCLGLFLIVRKGKLRESVGRKGADPR